MKKTTKHALFVGICVTLALIITNIVLLFVFPKVEKKNIYGMTALVIDISRPTDTVTVRDFNGNLWQFKGAEDWMVNDICSCVMDNKNTSQIKDDEIISVRYDGYFEGWAK